MEWRDLMASVQATRGVVFAGGFWGELVRRALFSRVFLLYALLAGMFAWSVAWFWAAAGDAARIGPGAQLLVVFAFIGWADIVLGFVLLLLLPYVWWSLLPPAARRLAPKLQISLHQNAEPPFGSFLAWTGPLFGAVLLACGAALLPIGHPSVAVAVLAALVVLIFVCGTKLFARSALAAVVSPEQREAFLAATRVQRLLLWTPALLASTLLPAFVAATAAGLLRRYGFAGLVVPLLLYVFVAVALAVAFTGILLRACARFGGDAAGGPDGGNPLTRGARPRRAVVVGGTLAALVALGCVLYAARGPLTDWWLTGDRDYHVGALPSVLEPPDVPLIYDHRSRTQRLRAGYIVMGCKGRMQAARWIHGLDVTEPADHARLLACAACQGKKKDAVHWLLQLPSSVPVDTFVSSADGRPLNALQCAARDNDPAVVAELLRRGGRRLSVDGETSAVQLAAGHAQVLALLQQDPDATAREALDSVRLAYARGRNPQEYLSKLRQAGLGLDTRDADGRGLLHWVAMHHDLPLAMALLEAGSQGLPESALRAGDAQGAPPWVYVLRKAEIDGRRLSREAAELLARLAPSEGGLHYSAPGPARTREGRHMSLPVGWTPFTLVINDPAALRSLGDRFDVGRLPQDPSLWWNFAGERQAREFVGLLHPNQLLRAEDPEPVASGRPPGLSTALDRRGWTQLAADVRSAVERARGETRTIPP